MVDESASQHPVEYVVVARRYRPRTFAELIGQDHVAPGLTNAIQTSRVGHAYLFTGARGVGKTSAARILAKALNCPEGPAIHFDNSSDICQSIDAGEDVDVLEIDGASNRGIDEIRQLRSNVNVRPSRSRYKIYIIDEVHMLTNQAFNALLKTLEEPPDHVKFIFCTTDPEKIPITVLSRCQRYDFAPIETDEIVKRLQFVVDSEGLRAEPDALALLARRANGSMRDSQSLLEQLLAFCDGTITEDSVHSMLGTAQGGRLVKLAKLLGARDAAGALAELNAAVLEGVDTGQLGEQLLGYFRDVMGSIVGLPADMMLHSPASAFAEIHEMGRQWGLENALAAAQILDQALARMRQSVHGRILLEMAIVRICQLGDLRQLANVIEQLQSGAPAPSPRVAAPAPTPGSSPANSPTADKTAVREQKKTEKTQAAPPDTVVKNTPTVKLTAGSAESIWKQALGIIEDMTADYAKFYDRVAIRAPNRLVVSFRAEYTHQKEACERPDRKARIEETLGRIAGRPVGIDFDVLPAEPAAERPRPTPQNRVQRLREKEKNPIVRQAMELFEAEILRVDEPRS